MGEVFQAIALATGQRVAVKIVNRSFADTLMMQRLKREAEAARRVQSDFVPRLYDVDSTPEGELFLVMERLQGETLSSRMRRRGGTITWEEMDRVGEDVLRGLIDAHVAGVIHRDLKPSNIFIESLPGRRERARVLDFGVCKLDAHDGEALTTTGEAVGTIAYMAPEQIRGASKVDERADLYAFAMVVFEALSGRLAYESTGSIALIAVKLEKTARSIRNCALVPLPPGLDLLIARCLARRPADRPASAEELLGAWRALGQATIAPTPTPAPPLPSEPPTETGITAAPTVTSRASRRGARIGLVVAAGALVASSVVLVVGLRLRVPSAAVPAPTASSGIAGAPILELPPVVLASSAEPSMSAVDPASLPLAPDESDAGAASRPGAGRVRAVPRRGVPAPPKRSPTGPQIASEPRY